MKAQLPTAPLAHPGLGGGHIELCLLGGFSLRNDGIDVSLPRHARRVVAYLSLDNMCETDCGRGRLADRLWPDARVEHARASLRTALWRIRQACPTLVKSDSKGLRLADAVWVDVHHFRMVAEQVLANNAFSETHDLRLMRSAIELLPGWDEDWLMLVREQLRHLRLHALEASARRLLGRGHHSDAIDVMLAVVAEEPLRESAQAALIGAHLAEGNVAEARRQFAVYSTQLWQELRLQPSDDLFRCVGLAAGAAGPV
jgi:DNA-binding SARP family transcriptional activator